MGQSASKGLSKVAQKVAKQARPEMKRPPIPSRTPQTPAPSAGNPGSFLRGEGAQDDRDRGQEMYLQQVQQQRQKQNQQSSDNNTPATNTTPAGNTEMPEDLLKFIQDVGPAKQSIDREFTTSRLLKEENRDELNKLESVRTARRERVRMPLMQGDDNFTTERNTNFSVSNVSALASSADEHDFGLTNVQLYDFLSKKGQGEDDIFVDDFHEKILSDNEKEKDGQPSSSSSSKAEEAKEKGLKLLSQTLDVLEIPTLRMNADGDILGLYPKDVPGPEMTSISPLPESKIIIVLKDLLVNGPINEAELATEKLTERRRERKSI